MQYYIETTVFNPPIYPTESLRYAMTDLAKYLEHTVLKPETTLNDVRRLCEEAIQYQVAAVCVPPLYVRDARRMFPEISKIRVATVVGFPMGYNAIAGKSEEIKRALDEGADDIDAMVNLAAVKSGNWNHVHHDIDSIARATHMRGRTLKLILECGMLTEAEIDQLCQLAHEARVAYVKTGTGFHNHPVTPEMVAQLRRIANPALKIKAAGGVRTQAEVQALVDAGADRVGTSATLAILGVGVTTKV